MEILISGFAVISLVVVVLLSVLFIKNKNDLPANIRTLAGLILYLSQKYNISLPELEKLIFTEIKIRSKQKE